MITDINEFAEEIRAELGCPPDLAVRDLKTPYFYGKVLYIDGLVDGQQVAEFLIEPLMRKREPFSDDLEGLRTVVSYSGNMKEIEKEKCVFSLLGGSAVLLTGSACIELPVKKILGRAIAEPPTASVIKGPREGFVESMKLNCVLLRKRIRDKALVFRELEVGKRTVTPVTLAYLNDVTPVKIADEIEKRLQKVEIDGALDSSYLTKMLEERPYSIFKQMGNSEKPDVIASRILDGKVAVICDGSPIVLYLPFMLIEDFEDSQDNYKRPARATFLRYIRLFAAFLAVFLPALFVSVQVHQFQLLPVELLVTVINSTGNIPFSPTLEMLIALVLFEILGEASIRMPRHVGMVLGVVGAIVLGDTAVKAGLLSSLTVLVVAMSGIGIFTVPDEVGTMGILRISFVVFGGLLGLFGILISAMCIIAYTSNLSSFEVPYLSPVAPILKDDLRDFLIKHNLTDLKTRPASYGLLDKTRLRRVK